MPSLLTKAITFKPVSPAAKQVLAALWDPNAPKDDVETTLNCWGAIGRDQLGKSLKRFLYHSLNLGDN